jgi:hypothetical protein
LNVHLMRAVAFRPAFSKCIAGRGSKGTPEPCMDALPPVTTVSAVQVEGTSNDLFKALNMPAAQARLAAGVWHLWLQRRRGLDLRFNHALLELTSLSTVALATAAALTHPLAAAPGAPPLHACTSAMPTAHTTQQRALCLQRATAWRMRLWPLWQCMGGTRAAWHGRHGCGGGPRSR